MAWRARRGISVFCRGGVSSWYASDGDRPARTKSWRNSIGRATSMNTCVPFGVGSAHTDAIHAISNVATVTRTIVMPEFRNS